MKDNTGLFFFIYLMKITSLEAFPRPCSASMLTVQRVPGCPKDELSNLLSARKKNCSAFEKSCDSFEYHCVLSDDIKTAVEVCAPSVIIVGYVCAKFSNQFQSILRVDEMECGNSTVGCPFVYNSTSAYKYPDCFGYHRERGCQTKDSSCIQESYISVHGDWSEWNDCSATCGGGVQQRIINRACNNTKTGGNICEGSKETKERRCNTQTCPVNGQWSLFVPFGDWSQCSSSCNNGTKARVRIRTCSEPSPLYGGKPCVGQSISTETITCNMQPCSEKQDLSRTTFITIALVSLVLFIFGGLLICLYGRYKRTLTTQSVPQSQPEVYREIHGLDITNNIYDVPSYAEYIPTPQQLNRPMFLDVPNTITEEFPIESNEKPMFKSRNSYITVLPDESNKPEQSAIEDRKDYLICFRDIEESEKSYEMQITNI